MHTKLTPIMVDSFFALFRELVKQALKGTIPISSSRHSLETQISTFAFLNQLALQAQLSEHVDQDAFSLAELAKLRCRDFWTMLQENIDKWIAEVTVRHQRGEEQLRIENASFVKPSYRATEAYALLTRDRLARESIPFVEK